MPTEVEISYVDVSAYASGSRQYSPDDQDLTDTVLPNMTHCVSLPLFMPLHLNAENSQFSKTVKSMLQMGRKELINSARGATLTYGQLGVVGVVVSRFLSEY